MPPPFANPLRLSFNSNRSFPMSVSASVNPSVNASPVNSFNDSGCVQMGIGGNGKYLLCGNTGIKITRVLSRNIIDAWDVFHSYLHNSPVTIANVFVLPTSHQINLYNGKRYSIYEMPHIVNVTYITLSKSNQMHIRHSFIRALKWMSKYGIFHNDLTIKNILIEKDAVLGTYEPRIIDWEMITIGHPGDPSSGAFPFEGIGNNWEEECANFIFPIKTRVAKLRSSHAHERLSYVGSGYSPKNIRRKSPSQRRNMSPRRQSSPSFTLPKLPLLHRRKSSPIYQNRAQWSPSKKDKITRRNHNLK